MTRHGPIRTRTGAIALRLTARAVLDAGNADLDAKSRTISSRGSDRIQIKTNRPSLGKRHDIDVAAVLSGDFTSKSP